MKITDPQQPVSDPNLEEDDLDVSEIAESDDASAFSQVLSKKREGKEEDADTKGGKRADKPFDPAAAGLMHAATAVPDQPIQAGQVESKRMVAVPPEVQQLVREISVVVNTAGKQQVHIELNSNVMQGLHIRIERQEGAITIQFQSSSADVSRLLLRNADALSQGLVDRGLNVADIRVTGPQDSTRVPTHKYRSGSGQSQGRGQGGRR
jgi:flagellar hook-length control protein FliK